MGSDKVIICWKKIVYVYHEKGSIIHGWDFHVLLFSSLTNSEIYYVILFWPSPFYQLESIWSILQLSLENTKFEIT
jgi:hypothetical protein